MKSTYFGLVAAAVLGFSLSGTGAKAETLQFTVVDGGNTAVFDVSESPTPAIHTSNLFQLDDIQVAITSNGSKTGVTENMDFYTASGNTEFIADSGSWFSDTFGNILTTGPYFTGSTSDPTFAVGTYGITGDSLSITNLAATPLPAALPLFAGGLGMVGFLAASQEANAQSELAAA